MLPKSRRSKSRHRPRRTRKMAKRSRASAKSSPLRRPSPSLPQKHWRGRPRRLPISPSRTADTPAPHATRPSWRLCVQRPARRQLRHSSYVCWRSFSNGATSRLDSCWPPSWRSARRTSSLTFSPSGLLTAARRAFERARRLCPPRSRPWPGSRPLPQPLNQSPEPLPRSLPGAPSNTRQLPRKCRRIRLPLCRERWGRPRAPPPLRASRTKSEGVHRV
mmetsp:Transcript_38807/g.112165  ORF Transcript_38807/g.112165 Transcript_38807/m.112165 type:complete len:219 (+) Transcript_38807:501-1157(+)